MNSILLYEGASPCGHQDIIVVATSVPTSSNNDKTGDMIQVYILLKDVHPLEAIKLGLDVAICGNCPYRNDLCYVNVAFAACMIWKSYQKGNIPSVTKEQAVTLFKFRGVPIRWGAYGDPGMYDYELIKFITDACGMGHTSYTHQWMEPWFDERHLEYSMASVDHENTVEKLRAIHPNARYYRVAKDYSDLAKDEIACPSSGDDRVMGKGSPRKVTCNKCLLCSGTSKSAKNVVIIEND